MSAIKAEDGGHVKPEPDDQGSFHMLDDDDYEDTGELEFPERQPEAWLARVPEILYQHWSKIDDDEEVQLGVVRRYKQSNKYQMILDPKVKHNEKVPKRYIVNKKGDDTANTFVFSEKDMPGYRKSGRGRGPRPNGKDALGVSNDAGIDKSRRRPQQFMRAIPKQTALTATIKTEANCVAVDDEDTRRAVREHQEAEDRKRSGMNFYKGDPRKTYNVAEKNGQLSLFGALGGSERTKKLKPQENKAARMPRNELIDRIMDCYKRYPFWALSTLRDELHQPEHYLKQTLIEVADLQRSGKMMGKYGLKPEATEEFLNQLRNEPDFESASDQDDEDSFGSEDPPE